MFLVHTQYSESLRHRPFNDKADEIKQF